MILFDFELYFIFLECIYLVFFLFMDKV